MDPPANKYNNYALNTITNNGNGWISRSQPAINKYGYFAIMTNSEVEMFLLRLLYYLNRLKITVISSLPKHYSVFFFLVHSFSIKINRTGRQPLVNRHVFLINNKVDL